MDVRNNTPLTLEQVEALPVLGSARSDSLRRIIVLRQHPTDAGRVISVGTACDGSHVVIADESKEVWTLALHSATEGGACNSE
jgi:hypothetical protein